MGPKFRGTKTRYLRRSGHAPSKIFLNYVNANNINADISVCNARVVSGVIFGRKRKNHHSSQFCAPTYFLYVIQCRTSQGLQQSPLHQG